MRSRRPAAARASSSSSTTPSATWPPRSRHRSTSCAWTSSSPPAPTTATPSTNASAAPRATPSDRASQGDAAAPLALGPVGRPPGPTPLPRLRRAAHGKGDRTSSKPTRASSQRNDYRDLVRARATANRVLGAERVFGWGAPAREQPFAELLMEAVVSEDDWWTTAPRELDPTDPLEPSSGRSVPIGWWLRTPSFTERTRPPAVAREAWGPPPAACPCGREPHP